jgi:4-hydroxy-3-methylbut-2-en-1-yl diphosphate synthase IspG/GcpE
MLQAVHFIACPSCNGIEFELSWDTNTVVVKDSSKKL